MGAVYDAVDTTLDRHVALKVITPALADDPQMRERFVREARAQASLDSPHVVQVFSHGEVDGRLHIVTQLVPDGDLGRFVRRHGPLEPGFAADLVAQVADGLAAAHRAGLVHRDIKASNVLLRHRGTDTVAQLADFGIADAWSAGEMAADVVALGRLLGSVLADGVGRELAAVVGAARSADELRDGLRSWGTGRRSVPPGGRRGRRRLVAGVAVAAVVVVGVGGVLAGGGASDDLGPEARVARALQQQAGLDDTSATCAAHRIVERHGVEGWRRPEHRDDVLAAVAACLWWPQPSASRISPRIVATYKEPSGPR